MIHDAVQFAYVNPARVRYLKSLTKQIVYEVHENLDQGRKGALRGSRRPSGDRKKIYSNMRSDLKIPVSDDLDEWELVEVTDVSFEPFHM